MLRSRNVSMSPRQARSSCAISSEGWPAAR